MALLIAWDFEALNARVYGDAAVSYHPGQVYRNTMRLAADGGSAVRHVWPNLDGRWQLVVRLATRTSRQ